MSAVEIDSLLAVIGILIFVYKNPHKKLITWTSLFILIIFLSEWFLYFWDELVGQLIWIVGMLGLVVSYYLRFRTKETKDTWDYFKWTGVMLIILYPWTVYENDDLWTVLRLVTFPLLTTMFVYDRFVFKPERMKKRFLIILIVQSLLLLLIFTYAIVLKNQANRLTIDRMNAREEIEKLKAAESR